MVLPGLPVVPGVHAELANIDEAGCWKETRTFVYEQRKGASGRTLWGWRQLRERRPELVKQVEISSQSASNVDSIMHNVLVHYQAE